MSRTETNASALVGVVPAAGIGRRLGRRPRSKELEPVFADPERGGRPSPVAFCLLRALAASGVHTAYVVSSVAKPDIRSVLGEGDAATPRIEHVVVDASPSAAFTVSVGTRRAGEAPVALGFPDVLWKGERAFARLADLASEEEVEIALGLFPPAPDYATHGVRLGEDGGVAEFEPPERAAGLPTWTLAVWNPPFSRFLEDLVDRRARAEADAPELTMTDVFAAALDAGLPIAGLQVSDRPFLDIGNPERLVAAHRACRGNQA